MTDIQKEYLNRHIDDRDLYTHIQKLTDAEIKRLIYLYEVIDNLNIAYDKTKLDKFISAYITLNKSGKSHIMASLLAESYFICHINELTEEEIQDYIALCTRSKLGKLVYNPILLANYNAKDHIRICEFHYALGEKYYLDEFIIMAARHKAKPDYIEKMCQFNLQYRPKGELMDKILESENFYLIQSDFERLMSLEYLSKCDDFYVETLLRHIILTPAFTLKNSVFDILDFINILINQKNRRHTDNFMLKLNQRPKILETYTVNELGQMYTIIIKDNSTQDFFFNKFILEHLSGAEVLSIYNNLVIEKKEKVSDVLRKIQRIILKYGKKSTAYLELLERENNTLKYSPKDSGQWIDIMSNNTLYIN